MKIHKPRKKYLTYDECAEYLNRSASQVYLLIKSGDLEKVSPEIVLQDEKNELHQAPNARLAKPMITIESAEAYKIGIDQKSSYVGRSGKKAIVYIKGKKKPREFDSIKDMLANFEIPLSAWRDFKDTGKYYKDKYKFESGEV